MYMCMRMHLDRLLIACSLRALTDSSPKAIAVPLTNDDIFESPDEMITLRIDHVTHKDMRGSERQETRIVIEDDQDAGVCEPGRRRAIAAWLACCGQWGYNATTACMEELTWTVTTELGVRFRKS